MSFSAHAHTHTHLANIFCYVAEQDFVEKTGLRSLANFRYLDYFFVPDPIPSEQEYGMRYATAGEGNSVTYIGLRIYEKEGKVRTTLYDREEEYPFHIRRYPAKGSAQTKGILMGRFVAAQELCSTLADFQ